MHTLKARLLPQSQLQRGLLTVAIVFALLASIAFSLNITLSGVDKVKDIAAIIQSSVAAAAIVTGGIFAYYKLQLFRDFKPHLTISHNISHRILSDSYMHIDVTATLHNRSKVQIELRKGFSRLQGVAPVSDEEVESLYAGTFEDMEHDTLQWPTLDEVDRVWEEGELIVEPGESHAETFEFIVGAYVYDTVLVYSYFYKPEASQDPASTRGWHATAVHDIVERVS